MISLGWPRLGSQLLVPKVNRHSAGCQSLPAAGVGSINNTFGIKGVAEHTFFFKSITDAAKLRRQVGFAGFSLRETFQQFKQHPAAPFYLQSKSSPLMHPGYCRNTMYASLHCAAAAFSCLHAWKD